MKIVTLSFDDGILQDERLVSILNACRLKGTFNLNSARLGTKGELTFPDKRVAHDKIAPERVKSLYQGHEVAAHTLTHPDLKKLSYGRILREIEEDRRALEAIAERKVIGFAYPGAHPNYNASVLRAVRETGVKYARTIENTGDFSLPEDFYRWRPTIQANDVRALADTVRRFLAEEDDESIKLLYIWGHSYEFDYYDSWEEVGKIFETLGNSAEIHSMTNGEVYRMLADQRTQEEKRRESGTNG